MKHFVSQWYSNILSGICQEVCEIFCFRIFKNAFSLIGDAIFEYCKSGLSQNVGQTTSLVTQGFSGYDDNKNIASEKSTEGKQFEFINYTVIEFLYFDTF